MAEEKGFELSRNLYKEFKNMNREKMQTVLANVYKQGAESVETASVDLDELRKVCLSSRKCIKGARKSA